MTIAGTGDSTTAVDVIRLALDSRPGDNETTADFIYLALHKAGWTILPAWAIPSLTESSGNA